ncbi:MAG: glycosyl hydrolase family 32, partial [Eubacteriales bacterium]|nr:glycosyl hydrolase family 32 [Eubacteriales bacterium]
MNALQKDLKKLAALAEAAPQPPDPWRLRFHLMPPVGWLNDPNGLCQFGGEYHVFYQYAPFEAEGGIKFWGHYKSRDLLRWEQCPVMLYSDQPYDIHGVYSGSALVQEDGLYLYYTGNVKHAGDYDYIRAGRGHNTVVAYSPDGVTLGWKRLLMENRDYPEGLSCHVRDPKVWEQDGRYYMVQGARTLDDEGVVLVFESDDRLHWRH